MTKINWTEHVTAFGASSQTAAAYCASVGIKLETFRYHLYKQKRRQRPKRFKEFQVATELVPSPHGPTNIKGSEANPH